MTFTNAQFQANIVLQDNELPGDTIQGEGAIFSANGTLSISGSNTFSQNVASQGAAMRLVNLLTGSI